MKNDQSVLCEKLKAVLDPTLDVFKDEGCFGILRVSENGEMVYERCFGYKDIRTKEPITADSAFTLYSLSKPFCAIGLMRLFDLGKVDIDVHPGNYLPEAKDFHPDLKIYQLLNHTAGIPDFVQTEDFYREHAGGGKSERELLPILAKYQGFFEPGKDGKYTNVNFVLAAYIIESVSGIPYAEYMKKEVFEPLGAKTAVIDRTNLTVENRIQGHDRTDDGRIIPVEKSYFSMLGAGDIVGRADDVYCLGEAIKKRKLLSEGSWKRVLTPSPINGMGYGCSVYTHKGMERIQHNGGSAGFRTLHFMIPEFDIDVIFLTNSGFGDYRSRVSDAVYSARFGNIGEDGKIIEMDKGYI